MFWCRQTVERPEASLSAGRRGTLTPPELRSLGPRGQDRRQWLQRLGTHPAEAWSTGRGWGFENRAGVYGSFLFDDFVFEREHRTNVLEAIDDGYERRRALFLDVWAFARGRAVPAPSQAYSGG